MDLWLASPACISLRDARHLWLIVFGLAWFAVFLAAFFDCIYQVITRTMWFEARKQERKIRTVMVDHKRRQERRRTFYEKIRKDPTEFMQVHGRQCKIHVDLAIAQAAENAAILRPWQGDPQVLIDRFDARSHLDTIVEYKGEESDLSQGNSEERRRDRRTNYERYRILVFNDFEKITEDKFLKQIYVNEYFGGVAPHHEEKKKKPMEQRAAIAYTYEDSTGPATSNTKSGRSGSGEENSEDEEDETDEDELADELLQITERRLNVTTLSREQSKALDDIAANYSIAPGDFTKFMWEDHEEEQYLQQLKDMEREKASLAGKQSRRERKLLKEVHARSRARFDGTSGFLALVQPLRPDTIAASSRRSSDSSDSSSGSSSRHSSPDSAAGNSKGAEKIEYITSFGGEKEGSQPTRKDESKAGSKTRRTSTSSSSSSQRRSQAKRLQRDVVKERTERRGSSSRDRDWRGSRRGRDWHTAGRRHSSSDRRLRKYSPGKRRYRRSSSSNTSSSSNSRRCGKTRSPNYKQSFRSPPSKKTTYAGSISANRVSEEKQATCDSGSELSMLSIRSSMSEQEQEMRQVENTKRRLKNTKRKVRDRASSQHRRSDSPLLPGSKAKTLTLRERLALQTQKALKKTVAKDKEEESKRRELLLREQMEREEEMREMTNLIRQKEREKRDREVETETKATLRRSVDESSRSSRRSGSGSSPEDRRGRSPRKRYYSRSRSKSRCSDLDSRTSRRRSKDGRDSRRRYSRHRSRSASRKRRSGSEKRDERATREKYKSKKRLVDY